MLMRKLLRLLRGRQAERPGARSTTRLLVETLEDRLALSSTSFNWQHHLWRHSLFSLDQGAALSSSIQLLSTNDVRASEMEGSKLIGLDRVFADYGYRGTGYSVAVIDTGIDYSHTALGGGWGRRVVAGWDFVNDDGDPMDDNGHGTHVAGIIGSSDSKWTGVAPNVNFVALKVLDKSGSGNFGDVEDALQWVAANQARYNIVAINMSLGAGNYTSNPYTFLDDEFQTLKNQGVFIAAAAGNSFYTYNSAPGLGYAAISPLAVGVGAVWAGNFGQVSWMSGARDYSTAADRVASFSQRSSALDLLAPGALLTSTYKGGGFQTMAGTSMATPVVAGAAAIIHQALDATAQSSKGNQDFILSLMKSTGANVVDGDDENDNVTNTGLTFKRLDLYAALKSIAALNTAPALDAIADRTMKAGQNTIVVTLTASDAEQDPLTFTARTSDSRIIAIVRGTELTLDPAPGFTGTAQIDVTVSDGKASASRSFRLTVTNVAPTLSEIANQSMRTQTDKITISLSGSDTDGDALTYSARLVPSKAALAYQLDQQLGWYNYGSYYQNQRGYNEKYVRGNVSGKYTWYVIMPNGEVYRWAGNMSESLKVENRIATFDSSYWSNPSLLWDAKPVSPSPVTLTVTGNQLTIDPAAGYTGSFEVEATVDDGTVSVSRTVTVTVTNTAPVLNAIADLTIGSGQDQATVNLSASDADGDSLTYTSRVLQNRATQAYQLDQQLGWYNYGSYFQNQRGYNEKYIRGYAGGVYTWYVIMPNGEIYRWAGNMTESLKVENRIATFDSSYWTDPSLLWDAKPVPPNPVTLSISGNQLTVDPTTDYRGSFQVEVTVTDGADSHSRTFWVTVL